MNSKKLLEERIAKYEKLCNNELTPKEEKELKKVMDAMEGLDPEERKKAKKDILNASLEEKINRTKMLIMDWYFQHDGNVYVSFSGGKDSAVLLHLVRSIFPDVPAVFADTGLEFPENKQFVKTIDNVITVRPKMSFKQVLEKYSFPVVSKEQSQYIMQYRNAKSEKTKHTRWFGNKWGQGKISEKWKFLVDVC